MKKTIYKVQTSFHGEKTPMIATIFNTDTEAFENYRFQKERKDCSFCNIIKIEAEVLDGDTCENMNDTFKFGI